MSAEADRAARLPDGDLPVTTFALTRLERRAVAERRRRQRARQVLRRVADEPARDR